MTRGYQQLRIRVTPSVRKEYVKEGKSGTIEIAVREKAKGGQANERVRELLAAYCNVPLKNVQIVKGAASRGKIVKVYGYAA